MQNKILFLSVLLVSLTFASTLNFNFALSKFSFETSDHKVASNVLCTGMDGARYYFAPDFTKELNMFDWFDISSKEIRQKLDQLSHLNYYNMGSPKKPLNGEYTHFPDDTRFKDFLAWKGQLLTIISLSCSTKDGKQSGTYTIKLLENAKYMTNFGLIFDNKNGVAYPLTVTLNTKLHDYENPDYYSRITLNPETPLKLYKTKK